MTDYTIDIKKMIRKAKHFVSYIATFNQWHNTKTKMPACLNTLTGSEKLCTMEMELTARAIRRCTPKEAYTTLLIKSSKYALYSCIIGAQLRNK